MEELSAKELREKLRAENQSINRELADRIYDCGIDGKLAKELISEESSHELKELIPDLIQRLKFKTAVKSLFAEQKTPETTSIRSTMKTLTNWCVTEKQGLIVIKGKDESGTEWTTSSILKRIHRFEVQTQTGSTYRLLGDSRPSGDSYYDDKFSNGFPHDWNSHLSQASKESTTPQRPGGSSLKRKLPVEEIQETPEKIKRRKVTRFVMPKAYPTDVDFAIKNNSMTNLQKSKFIRYMASHFYAQAPNPTPTEYNTMAQQCVKVCPSLADTQEMNHKEKLSSKFAQRFRNMRRCTSKKTIKNSKFRCNEVHSERVGVDKEKDEDDESLPGESQVVQREVEIEGEGKEEIIGENVVVYQTNGQDNPAVHEESEDKSDDQECSPTKGCVSVKTYSQFSALPHLQNLFHKVTHPVCDEASLDETFQSRRKWLSRECPLIEDIIEKYPAFRNPKCLLHEFKKLLPDGEDKMIQRFRNLGQERPEEQLDFLMETQSALCSSKVMANLIDVKPVTVSVDMLLKQKSYPEPRLVILEGVIQRLPKSSIIIAEGQVICTIRAIKKFNIVEISLVVLIAAFYVFDVKYPQKHINMFNFIQEYLLGLKLSKTSKVYDSFKDSLLNK